jgi:hypothetical protein
VDRNAKFDWYYYYKDWGLSPVEMVLPSLLFTTCVTNWLQSRIFDFPQNYVNKDEKENTLKIWDLLPKYG